MQRPLLLLRTVFGASLNATAVSAGTAILAAIFALTGLGFLVAGGFILLARDIGVPATAMCFGLLFVLLAILSLLIGRSIAQRRHVQALIARQQLVNEVAALKALVPAAGLWPAVGAFIMAFLMARR